MSFSNPVRLENYGDSIIREEPRVRPVVNDLPIPAPNDGNGLRNALGLGVFEDDYLEDPWGAAVRHAICVNALIRAGSSEHYENGMRSLLAEARQVAESQRGAEAVRRIYEGLRSDYVTPPVWRRLSPFILPRRISLHALVYVTAGHAREASVEDGHSAYNGLNARFIVVDGGLLPFTDFESVVQYFQSAQATKKEARSDCLLPRIASDVWPAPDWDELAAADPWGAALQHAVYGQIHVSPYHTANLQLDWNHRVGAAGGPDELLEQFNRLRGKEAERFLIKGLAGGEPTAFLNAFYTTPLNVSLLALQFLCTGKVPFRGIQHNPKDEGKHILLRRRPLALLPLHRDHFSLKPSQPVPQPGSFQSLLWQTNKDTAAPNISNAERTHAANPSEYAHRRFSVQPDLRNGYAVVHPLGTNALRFDHRMRSFRDKQAAVDWLDKPGSLAHLVRELKRTVETPFDPDFYQAFDWSGYHRAGPPRRTGDISVTGFVSTYRPRALQFGIDSNQADRQQMLNLLFDQCADLATLLDVSPELLFGNGKLGIVIGSNHFSHSACFLRRGASVLLSKRAGALGLFHEWFHAIDSQTIHTEIQRSLRTAALLPAPVLLPGDKDPYADWGSQAVLSTLLGASEAATEIEDCPFVRRSKQRDRYRIPQDNWFPDYFYTCSEMGARAFESAVSHLAPKQGITGSIEHLAQHESYWHDAGRFDRYPWLSQDERAAYAEPIVTIARHILDQIVACPNSVTLLRGP